MRLVLLLTMSLLASTAYAEQVEVPMDIGVGPAGFSGTGLYRQINLFIMPCPSQRVRCSIKSKSKNTANASRKISKDGQNLDEVRIGHILVPDIGDYLSQD